MLFNVYYDETHFPYLDKIKYIVNETTKEKLTLDEFIAAIPTFYEVNHIGRFNVFYPFLEKRLIADGFICKTTKTDYYSVYRSKLAPHSYVADITIKLSAAEANKNVNKMRIRGLTGEAKYLISFDAFTNYQEVNTPFPEEEIYYSSFLNQIKCKSSSPAGAMREDVPDKSVFKYAASIERDFCMDLINSMTYPAVIEAYAYGHFDEAYSYDVISMYPAMLSKIKHLPSLISARKITEHMIIPENCFG